MDESPPGKYVFDGFTFDAGSGELLREGRRLRLPEQNARLLTLLLKRPRILVERQELRLQLWPNGEHLNHDHAISNSINQLRSVLRDNPRTPAFIETLPKRGYRFIADVRFEPTVGEVVPASPAPEEVIPLPSEGPSPAGASEVVTSRAVIPKAWIFTTIPVLIMLVVCFYLFHRHQANIATSRGDLTLAIVPIKANGPLAQQLAEPFRLELTDTASQLPGVQVRVANSIGAAPIDLTHPSDLANKLEVDVLLIGHMSSSGTALDLSFELVRRRDAMHLASFHYRGTQDSLGNIRSEMERDLFRTLSDTKHNHLNPLHSTENTQAYSDYLAARSLLIEHTDESIARAVATFRHATEEDHTFAQAYSGLGSASMLLAEHLSDHKEENYADARTASQTAIVLNPRVAEAHATLGFLLFRHDWNAAAAEPELQRAVELEPGQAMHRIMYALLLGNTGRLEQAMQQVDRALAADPLWPPVYLTEMYLAAAKRDNARALMAAHLLLRLKPDWTLAHDQSAWAFWYAGRHEEAIREWIRMAEIEHDDARANLERKGLEALHQLDVRSYAKLKVGAASQKVRWHHPNDFELAEWQLNAGRKQLALASLKQMIEAHDPESLQIGVSPAYFSLHGDPGFDKLLKLIIPIPASSAEAPTIRPKSTHEES